MAANSSYDTIVRRYFPERQWVKDSYPECPDKMLGVMPQEITFVLSSEGIRSAWITPCEGYRTDDENKWLYTYQRAIALPSLSKLQKFIDKGGAAILGVPSLNTRGAWHWVYTEDERLYDPAIAGKTYPEHGAKLEICEAVLVW